MLIALHSQNMKKLFLSVNLAHLGTKLSAVSEAREFFLWQAVSFRMHKLDRRGLLCEALRDLMYAAARISLKVGELPETDEIAVHWATIQVFSAHLPSSTKDSSMTLHVCF